MQTTQAQTRKAKENAIIKTEKKRQEQRQGHFYSSKNQKLLSPVNQRKHKTKKQGKKSTSSKFAKRDVNYIWHPLQMQESSTSSNYSAPGNDVMKHFRNQYHKQGSTSASRNS